MERAKNRSTARSESSALKVVVVKNDQTQVEKEIEKHIKKIKALIQKLHPPDRQRYFLGMLSHIISEPTDLHSIMSHQKLNFDINPTRLTTNEMQLLEELSLKIEQLYRTLDHDPS